MIKESLMKIVKSDQNITWCDKATEEKLSLIVENGINYLDSKAGYRNNYEKPGDAQTLLLAYVMYSRDGLLHEFAQNYRKEIIAFINKAKVKMYENK